MSYNEFKDISGCTYMMTLLAGLWGAIVNFLTDRREKTWKQKIVGFLFDFTVSIGITTLSFLILVGYGYNGLFAVGVAGFLGHEGTRLFYVATLVALEKLGADKTYELMKDLKGKEHAGKK